MTITNHDGPALDIIRDIPDGSVDLIATSPPFLALRNYNGVEGQWGSEAHPAEFLDNLLALTAEFRRVLAPHGSIAVELGDTYSGSGGGGGDYLTGGMRDGQNVFNGSAASAREANAEHWRQKAQNRHQWPRPKSLCMVPTLYPASLAYGRNLLNPDAAPFDPWLVRNLIVWARNNPPVGALGDKVRPATSYITVACPSGKRWFDLDAVRTEAMTGDRVMRQTTPTFDPARTAGLATHGDRLQANNPAGAPPLDHWHDEPDGHLTWLINTAGSSLAHYAMWPPKLAERLVLSMCPLEVCRDCGEPRRRITQPSASYAARPFAGQDFVTGDRGNGQSQRNSDRPTVSYSAVGRSDCGHGNYRPGATLDPFAGTGTTLAVADIHGRDAIGIDIDPANQALHAARHAECKRALFDVAPPIAGQLDIFEATE